MQPSPLMQLLVVETFSSGSSFPRARSRADGIRRGESRGRLPILGEVVEDRVELSALASERYERQWGGGYRLGREGGSREALSDDQKLREIAELEEPERWDGLA